MLGCETSPSPRAAFDTRVYAAALDTLVRPGETIVLLDSTRAPYAKSRGRPLPKIVLPGRTLILAPWDALTTPNLSHDDYWQRFHSRFPGAVAWCSMSKISYTLLGQRASLYADCGCGLLCGASQVITLVNEAGVWRVVKVHTISVS